DRIVRPVGFLDLVQRLRDQEGFQAIASHEGQCGLEKVEAAERRKFVEHEQETMASGLRLELFGQAAADLVEQQADQRLGPVDVTGWHDKVEGGRSLPADNVANTPVAPARDLGDDGIAVQT